ncbi:MAG: hypothetical protein GY940_28660, partial [bacterium]|nr:hypothetical protein [bacterium]
LNQPVDEVYGENAPSFKLNRRNRAPISSSLGPVAGFRDENGKEPREFKRSSLDPRHSNAHGEEKLEREEATLRRPKLDIQREEELDAAGRRGRFFVEDEMVRAKMDLAAQSRGQSASHPSHPHEVMHRGGSGGGKGPASRAQRENWLNQRIRDLQAELENIDDRPSSVVNSARESRVGGATGSRAANAYLNREETDERFGDIPESEKWIRELGDLVTQTDEKTPAWRSPGRFFIGEDDVTRKRRLRKLVINDDEAFDGTKKDFARFWRSVDLSVAVSRVTKREALADCFARLLPKVVMDGLYLMGDAKSLEDWTALWNYLSRRYGDFDHFGPSQTAVLTFRPGKWDKPEKIKVELFRKLGEMNKAYEILRTSGMSERARNSQVVSDFDTLTRVKQNILNYGNEIVSDALKRRNPMSWKGLFHMLDDLMKSHFADGVECLWGIHRHRIGYLLIEGGRFSTEKGKKRKEENQGTLRPSNKAPKEEKKKKRKRNHASLFKRKALAVLGKGAFICTKPSPQRLKWTSTGWNIFQLETTNR